jgi:hypothetical protein
METMFRNQLFSKNQSPRGNVFAHSFPRNGPRHNIVFINLCSLTMLHQLQRLVFSEASDCTYDEST